MFDFTPPHLHLLVNHFPVEGSIIALALLIYAMIRRSAELKRIALVGFVLLGVAAYVSDLTGGGASREMRNVPGIERALIHEHTQAADWAKDISYVFAVVALLGLILAWRNSNNKEPNKWIVMLCLIGGLFEVATFAKTAYQGGLIRHPEIQSSFPVPSPLDTSIRSVNWDSLLKHDNIHFMFDSIASEVDTNGKLMRDYRLTHDTFQGGVLEARFYPIKYIDLNRDGREDAIITLFSGGSGAYATAAIFLQTANGPKYVGYAGGPHFMDTLYGDTLDIITAHWLHNEPQCCPEAEDHQRIIAEGDSLHFLSLRVETLKK